MCYHLGYRAGYMALSSEDMWAVATVHVGQPERVNMEVKPPLPIYIILLPLF